MQTLSLSDSIKLAQKHGITFAKTELVLHEKDLEEACKKIGFPVAMKVVSSKIPHKTDIGGVKTNIANPHQALAAFKSMRKLPSFEGILVQEMLTGTEIIIGGVRDIQFGPAVLFGLGGIYTEIFNDTVIRICPIDRKTALEMIKSIRSYPILAGVRGGKPANLNKIADAIISASNLMIKEKALELDINPLMATAQKVIAVDARIVRE